MNTIHNGLVEGKAKNETKSPVRPGDGRGADNGRLHGLGVSERCDRHPLPRWANLGLCWLTVVIAGAGVAGISQLDLDWSITATLAWGWLEITLLPLVRAWLKPAPEMEQPQIKATEVAVSKHGFGVIQGGRKPVVLESASKGALAAGLKLIDPRKQPEHYEAMAEAYARMLREERRAA